MPGSQPNKYGHYTHAIDSVYNTGAVPITIYRRLVMANCYMAYLFWAI